MEASTNKRAVRVITVRTDAQNSSDAITSDRWSAFWSGMAVSFFTSLVPVIGFFLAGENAVEAFAAPAGVGTYAASRINKKKNISRSYLMDGEPLKEKVALAREYRLMGLWDERTYRLPGLKSTIWKFPEKTSAEQAQRFFDRAQ